MTSSILKQEPNTYKIQGFKVFFSFWPLGARKRSYIRTDTTFLMNKYMSSTTK